MAGREHAPDLRSKLKASKNISISIDPLLKPRLTAYLKRIEYQRVISRERTASDLVRRYPEYGEDIDQLRLQMEVVFNEILSDEASVFGRVEHDLDEIHVDELTGEYQLSTGASLEFHWLDRLIIPPDVCAGCCVKEHRTLDCPALREGARCDYCRGHGHVTRACPKMHHLCHMCLRRGHWHGECNSQDEPKWQHFKTYGVLTSSEAFTYDVIKEQIVAEIRLKYGPETEEHIEAMPAYLWAWFRPKRVLTVPEDLGLLSRRASLMRDLNNFEWGNPIQMSAASHCMCCFSPNHRIKACPERRTFVSCDYCRKNGHLIAACVVLHNLCLVCMRRGHFSGLCREDEEEKWNSLKHRGGVAADPAFTYRVSKVEFVGDLKARLGSDWPEFVPLMPSFMQNWFYRYEDEDGTQRLKRGSNKRSAEVAPEQDTESFAPPPPPFKVPRAFVMRPHWMLTIGKFHCKCCNSTKHSTHDCPKSETAVCEYCNASDHFIIACPVMQGLCTKCFKRGHRTGKCSEADEEKWLRLKEKGALSRSLQFTYSVDKKAIVREILESSDDLNPNLLPVHLRQWLIEEESFGRKSLKAPKSRPTKAGAAVVLPPHLASVMPRQSCSNCLDGSHRTADCLLEGPCEYCGLENHNVVGCLLMHHLCVVCFRRGHKNGDCDAADEEKWNAFKGLGHFSQSPKFIFQMDQQEIVKEVKLRFGHERLLRDLKKLPDYIAEPLSKDANFIRYQAKQSQMSTAVASASSADELNETTEEPTTD